MLWHILMCHTHVSWNTRVYTKTFFSNPEHDQVSSSVMRAYRSADSNMFQNLVLLACNEQVGYCISNCGKKLIAKNASNSHNPTTVLYFHFHYIVMLLYTHSGNMMQYLNITQRHFMHFLLTTFHTIHHLFIPCL